MNLKETVQPAPNKTGKPKNPGHVEVKFSTSPEEFLYFNRYQVAAVGAFLEVSLWFQDQMSGTSLPVFRGMTWKEDFRGQVPGLKKYIEKVGVGAAEDQPPSRSPLWSAAPIAFNHFDCVMRGEYAEIVIRSFSHKFAVNAAMAGIPVNGTTGGAYVSEAGLHRQLVMELIKETELPKK